MFTKFITLFLDDLHDEEKGFITAARYLCENGIMDEAQRSTLQENLNWIESHLARRPDFHQSPEDEENTISIPMTWLKESAYEHLDRMDKIREILEENDILVEVLQVEMPGEIVYEDEHQVVAIPFQDIEPYLHTVFGSSL
ncbi:MAG: hypothetical protein HC880_17370 [Bacteroidia bacterium]|nr:hypothetical protein [Bacteroidia bacterium]